MKEEDYILKLRSEAQHNKKLCLSHIRSLHGDPTQALLRNLSWGYSFRHGQVSKDHLNLEFPLPIAKSDSDIYHQNHFIKATLFCIYFPTELPYEIKADSSPIVCLASSDLQRWEASVICYEALAQLISPQADNPKPPNRTNWQNELLNLTQETNTMVRAIHGRLSLEDKDLDPKPNRRRKLPIKE